MIRMTITIRREPGGPWETVSVTHHPSWKAARAAISRQYAPGLGPLRTVDERCRDMAWTYREPGVEWDYEAVLLDVD